MSKTSRRTKYPGYLKLGRVASMRYLYFDAQAGLKEPSTTYEMVYDSLINSPGGYEGPKENRTISRIFDKLEKIGNPTRRNNQDVFDLRADEVVCVVALEDSEFELVTKVLNSIKWTGSYARRASAMFEWLEKSPHEERKAKETPEVLPG